MITSALYNYLTPVLDDMADDCVENYRHASYGGHQWSFCNTTALGNTLGNTTFSDPFIMESQWSYGNWNDELTSFTMPDDMVITMYQSIEQGGSSVTFQTFFPFGKTSGVPSMSEYSFNDMVSSYSMTHASSGQSINWMLELTRHGDCVDVAGGGTANGTKIQQWDCQSGNTNQLFRLQAVGSYYMIKHQASGKCLDVDGGGTANGTKIQLWDCNTSNVNQLFTISSNTSTSSARDFKIVNAGNGKCVDLTGGSSSNGAQIQIWGCESTSSNQSFALKQL